MSKRKLCYSFSLGDFVIITKSGIWNGVHGIIDSIQHGTWQDKHVGYGTEYLVRSITGESKGRMVLYPDDFTKVDNPFKDLKRIRVLVDKIKIDIQTEDEEDELDYLLNKY